MVAVMFTLHQLLLSQRATTPKTTSSLLSGFFSSYCLIPMQSHFLLPWIPSALTHPCEVQSRCFFLLFLTFPFQSFSTEWGSYFRNPFFSWKNLKFHSPW